VQNFRRVPVHRPLRRTQPARPAVQAEGVSAHQGAGASRRRAVS
jgi:hypothetical protein